MANKIEENKMRGYISLYRSLKNWEWYDDVNVKVLFIELLLTCNWKAKSWKGEIVNRGEIITSPKQLALILNLTESKIKTALKKLQSTKEIAIKTTNKYTKISLLKFNDYQNEIEEDDKQIDNKSTTNREQKANKSISNDKQIDNKSLQLNKDNNNNKEKKENKENNKDIFENFRKIYPGTKKGLDTEFNNFKKKHSDWKEVLPKLNIAIQYQIKERESIKLKDPKAFVPNWKNLQTWVNQRCWEEEIGEVESNEEEINYIPVKPEVPDEEFDKFYEEMEFNKPIFDINEILGN